MLPAVAAILFYWMRMKVVQPLTCLTLGRPNGPAYLTDELLNTPQMTPRCVTDKMTCDVQLMRNSYLCVSMNAILSAVTYSLV